MKFAATILLEIEAVDENDAAEAANDVVRRAYKVPEVSWASMNEIEESE